MPDRGELRARLAAVEAELVKLVGPVTMKKATSVEAARYYELVREWTSLRRRLDQDPDKDPDHE